MIEGPRRGGVTGGSPCPSNSPGDRPAEHPPGGGPVEAGVRCRAQRQVEAALRAPIGGVGREHDPLGGHAREQLHDVEREEAGGVVEHPGVIGEHRGEDPLVADRPVGEDQHDLGVAQRELGEAPCDRGQPAAGVDQDRHAGLIGHLEDPLELAPVEGEPLRAGVELDPARARRDAAFRLGDRPVEGVEAAEWE